MNNDINEKIVHAAPVPPFVTFVASAVPMVFDNSMSYYEALCALWKWLQDDVIDVINNNASVTEQYIEYDLHTRELFIELKNYVDTYFDNLDVQEEINNKLDQMAEDGTLQEIITAYIQANVAWTFDTVADMKAATNLVNGSYARTLGFHSLNDGGGALYKITNSGTANEMDVIAIGDLRASLIIGEHANVMQFGAYGDDTHDDSTVINHVLANYNDVYIPEATYLTTNALTFTKSAQSVKCMGKIDYTGNESAIKFLSGNDNEVYIKDIASDGVGVLIEPTANCGRIKLDIRYLYSNLDCFKVAGNRATSSWYLYGLRWYSTTGYAVNLDIVSGSTNVYFNRFIFHEMALISNTSDTKGIILNNQGGSGCDIQVQFIRNNFEGVKGIRCTKVGYLTIDNCRITEIFNTDWLEFNNNIPNCSINASGRVALEHIKFNNITSGEEIHLNCRVMNGGYSYDGGMLKMVTTESGKAVLFLTQSTRYGNYYADNASNTIGDNLSDTSKAFMLPMRIIVAGSSNTAREINIPSFMYFAIEHLILEVRSSNVTVTVNYGTKTLSATLNQGVYVIFNNGDTAWYSQIN